MRSSVRGSKLMVEPGSLSLASTAATSISAVSPGETVSVSAFDSESPVSGESGSSETRAVDSSSCGLTSIGSGVAKCDGAGVFCDWAAGSATASDSLAGAGCGVLGAGPSSGDVPASGAGVDAGATSDAGAMGNAGAAGSGAANTAALSLIAAATGSAK